MEYVQIIIPAILLVAFFIFMIYLAVNDKKWKKQADNEQIEEQERKETAEKKEIKATVISKRILDSYEGFLVSRYVLDFLVAFQIDSETVEFSVTQEFFDKVEENDKGTLVTINDELYDFIKE